MNEDDDVARRLAESLSAFAHHSVGDARPIPPLQLNRARAARTRPVLTRVLAPLAAAAVVLGVAVGIAVAHSGSHATNGQPVAAASTGATAPAVSSAAATTDPHNAVKVSLQMSDGEQFGIGMPVIAYFSAAVTDGRALQQATTVTVNGKQVSADWYFTNADDPAGAAMQAHLRMKDYWPAHAQIAVALRIAGLSAGSGKVYADDLSLTFSTGAAQIATVDDSTHDLVLTRDGTRVATYPVSLGSPATPTMSGVKVIMEKGVNICMKGPGYDECNIKYTERLTYGGEYLHAAPWNVKNIAAGIDSSNGCTNLTTADAKALYDELEIGDVVDYPDEDGAHMAMADGYGDWNVPWSTWMTGGLAPTH